MEIHQKFPITATAMGRSLWRNRSLLHRLIIREVVGRYRGSFFGLAWSFFNPLLMLAIYTVVFSRVFDAKWNQQGEHTIGFALVLFVGMILHAFFSECITRAPSIILSNPNYIKKVVFPIEILSPAALGSALFHSAISFLVLISMYAVFHGLPPLSALMLPIILIPLLLTALGASWFLSSLGVFVRDVGQISTVLSTILLFISGVFFPASAAPANMQWIFQINPLAITIKHMRNAVLWGVMPDWQALTVFLLLSFGFAWLGFAWFQKTRTGFADVL